MREIKFRGKSEVGGVKGINKGDWIYGGIIYDDRIYIKMPYFEEVLVDKDTIGQYTGLKDKKGRNIYEGDIVKAHFKKGYWKYNDKNYYGYKNGSVEYCVDGFILYIKEYKEQIYSLSSFGDRKIEDLEVIGNIYDNKELLEE